jgi:MATE family multidrug resistance protein
MKCLKSTIYLLLKLAAPLVLTGVLQSATFFFDTIFLAHLGADKLAAGALVGWLFCTFIVILLGTLSSISILVARQHGAQNTREIALITRDGLWLSLLITIPACLLFSNIPQLFLFIGHSQTIVQLATSYLDALIWGLLPYFMTVSLLEVILGLGHMRLILIFCVLSISLSIFFSFSLIFGKFGLPALGIAGAGWGMTISSWITAISLFTHILRKETYRRYLHYIFIPTQQSYIIELVQIGVPLGLMYCVEVAFFFVLSLIIGSFGSALLAANQIVLQYLSLFMSMIFSIGRAITVRIGYLLGANNIAAAEHTGYVGIGISIVLMIIVAIGYLFFPTALISIDLNIHSLNNRNIVNYAIQFFTVSALFQLIEAARISLFSALRGLKDTRFTLFISIISFWGIALPIGYFLAHYLHFEAIGLWWGMIVSALFSVLVLYRRFKFKVQNYSHSY